jgi:subtilisin family serine protease
VAARYRAILAAIVIFLSAGIAAQPVREAPDDSTAVAEARATAAISNFESPTRVAGEYIIGFKRPAAVSALRRLPDWTSRRSKLLPDLMPTSRPNAERLAKAFAERAGGRVEGIYGGRNGRSFSFALVGVSEAAARLIAADPRVKYVDAVITGKFEDTQGNASNPAPWWLDRIDQRQLPLNHQYTYNTTALDVVVHVVDSGVRGTHTQFGTRANYRVWNCVGSADCIGDEDTIVPADGDCSGHGSRMASVIGGTTSGVAKGVWILSHRAGCGDSYRTIDLIEALENVYARKVLNWPNVVNLSLTLKSAVPAVDDAVEALIENNMVVVTGAGNDNSNACSYSPARLALSTSVITVAASASDDTPWWSNTFYGSNYGGCVSLFAPGANFVGLAVHTSNSAVTTQPSSGTSLATAVVSGLAALYLQTHASETPAQVKAALVNGATTNALTNLNFVGPGSPNKLAYSLLPAGSDPSPGGPFTPPGDPPQGVSRIIQIIQTVLQHLLN